MGHSREWWNDGTCWAGVGSWVRGDVRTRKVGSGDNRPGNFPAARIVARRRRGNVGRRGMVAQLSGGGGLRRRQRRRRVDCGGRT